MPESARGAKTGNLLEETHGHINSAFRNGMTTIVIVALHFIEMSICQHASCSKTNKCVQFATPDKDKFSQAQEIEQTCMMERARTISVKENEQEQNDFDATMYYET